ncbi:shikimate kinase [Xylocopilactobacillus apicola]|uniref:Uncharacterized protein n=1 Tax=Xylocopilactobacillus apicola TaxID=2932184 RepID=A0AAU9D7G2_9LACO|nr:shikimate kinase [Xylocopilactobacillus apicola]BDR59473.1 hypothetical protein XA3_19140 [Xylocopilactobacillus apicola]
MNKAEQNETIVLVGFWGIFQNQIGHNLAEQLNRPFYDFKEEVENQFLRLPPSQFDSIGWDEIHHVEEYVFSDLLSRQGSIISTGSDLVEDKNNLITLVESDAAIIYLHIKHSKSLVKYLATHLYSDYIGEQPVEKILQDYWKFGDEAYRNISDLLLETANKDAAELAHEIASFITTEVDEDDLF